MQSEIYVGTFPTESSAAKAHDVAALHMHREDSAAPQVQYYMTMSYPHQQCRAQLMLERNCVCYVQGVSTDICLKLLQWRPTSIAASMVMVCHVSSISHLQAGPDQLPAGRVRRGTGGDRAHIYCRLHSGAAAVWCI